MVPICGVRLYTDMLWYGPVVIGHRGKGDSKPTQHALAQLQSLTSDRTALATGWWLPRSLLYMRTVLGRALIAGTLQAASTSAIMSDRSSVVALATTHATTHATRGGFHAVPELWAAQNTAVCISARSTSL